MRHSRLLQHLVRSIFPVTVLLSVLWGNALESIVQDRSGNVALPRVKVVLASAALLVADGADERSAVRRALWRSSVVAIVVDVLTGRDEVKGTVGRDCQIQLIELQRSSAARTSCRRPSGPKCRWSENHHHLLRNRLEGRRQQSS